jgi:hypothetical protein
MFEYQNLGMYVYFYFLNVLNYGSHFLEYIEVHKEIEMIWWTFDKEKYYEKKGVLQLALELNFWVVEDVCNSLYLYAVSANRQVAWVEEL